jgi:hypothetical protein
VRPQEGMSPVRLPTFDDIVASFVARVPPPADHIIDPALDSGIFCNIRQAATLRYSSPFVLAIRSLTARILVLASCDLVYQKTHPAANLRHTCRWSRASLYLDRVRHCAHFSSPLPSRRMRALSARHAAISRTQSLLAGGRRALTTFSGRPSPC